MFDNYYSDHRVRAGNANSLLDHIDLKKMEAKFENDEKEYTVKIHFAVCPTCDGKGSHVNPSIDCNGISAEDFYNDRDFAEDYMQGMYDVPCYGCKGQRVVPEIDTKQTKKDVLELYYELIEDREQYLAIQESERRMGA